MRYNANFASDTTMSQQPPHQVYFQHLEALTAPGQPFEVIDRQIGGRPCKAYRNAPATLRELLDQGRAHGDKEFLVYEGQRYSFDQFFAEADAAACGLSAAGIRAGDRVAIAMRNYPEWMMAFTAIVTTGAVPVTINSWGAAEEILYVLDDSEAKWLFCDEARHNMLDQALTERQLPAIVVRPDLITATPNWEAFISPYQQHEKKPLRPPRSEDDIATIIYTSGTTGKPKGVVSLNRQVCQAIFNFECCGFAMAMTNGDLLGRLMELDSDYSALLAVPLFHVSGCYAVFMLNLRGGRRTVMMYKWDIKKALKYITRERVGVLSVAPAMLMMLFEDPGFADADTSRLYFIGGGGSAFPSDLPGLIDQKVPDRIPGCGYGSTETNASACSMNGHLFRARPKASGLPSPIMQLQIRGTDGHSALPTGERGEIWVYGISIAEGYWQKPELTAESFQDGWFRTGDIGYIDEDGYLFVVDRIKDIVIRAGENISSNEVEQALGTHPDVLEAGAFGIPHPQLGEELAAAVVIRPQRQPSVEQLQAHVGEQLAHFKVPAYIFLCHEPLPRNAAGKLLKNALRETHTPSN